jgi:hypothetical protein
MTSWDYFGFFFSHDNRRYSEDTTWLLMALYATAYMHLSTRLGTHSLCVFSFINVLDGGYLRFLLQDVGIFRPVHGGFHLHSLLSFCCCTHIIGIPPFML